MCCGGKVVLEIGNIVALCLAFTYGQFLDQKFAFRFLPRTRCTQFNFYKLPLTVLAEGKLLCLAVIEIWQFCTFTDREIGNFTLRKLQAVIWQFFVDQHDRIFLSEATLLPYGFARTHLTISVTMLTISVISSKQACDDSLTDESIRVIRLIRKSIILVFSATIVNI